MQQIDAFTHIDYKNLFWDVYKNSSGTAGTFLKAYENGVYYKASNFDSSRGFYGHESLNEIVARNLARMLEIRHLEYTLHYETITVFSKQYKTFFTGSKNFRKLNEVKMTLESYYEMCHGEQESIWDFICRLGWAEYFYDMFLFDWLIYNRDRHGANIEVLSGSDETRLAPLFDHGLSFGFSCYEFQGFDKFNKLADNPVNNYVGSRILSENLALVPTTVLHKVDAIISDKLFIDLDYKEIPNYYFQFIKSMLQERVEYVKKLPNY